MLPIGKGVAQTTIGDQEEKVDYDETFQTDEITTIGTNNEKALSKGVSTTLLPTATDETSGETTAQNATESESSDQNHMKMNDNLDDETVSNITLYEVTDNSEVKQSNSVNDSKLSLLNDNVQSSDTGNEEDTHEVPAFRLDSDMLDGITETVYQISRPSALRQINLK